MQSAERSTAVAKRRKITEHDDYTGHKTQLVLPCVELGKERSEAHGLRRVLSSSPAKVKRYKELPRRIAVKRVWRGKETREGYSQVYISILLNIRVLCLPA